MTYKRNSSEHIRSRLLDGLVKDAEWHELPHTPQEIAQVVAGEARVSLAGLSAVKRDVAAVAELVACSFGIEDYANVGQRAVALFLDNPPVFDSWSVPVDAGVIS